MMNKDLFIADIKHGISARYSCPTSFDKKYDHLSLLCKQMDIYVRKVYIVRKVTSAPTFLA